MVAQKPNCDIEKLREAFTGDAKPNSDTIDHIETCEVCRQTMQSWAGEASWWDDARDAFSGLSSDDPTYLFERGLPKQTQHEFASISLTFLDPSDNPAMLGRLGEFEILDTIGCGGMGIVLKGYDHELNRYVAVKVLHPFCATSAAARRRFVREAQAAAAIVHQHVVPIHAVDPNHHPPYLVMPFIPGESLQERLNRVGHLELVDVLRIGQQIAEGLAAAHAQGIVHRDIKPGNILLERNVERVLLTDFGLARAADDASLTRSGVIAGTPQFMAPEQARGEQIDHRTDLFSLGTVLYTMLAGHSPFRAETTMSILRRLCDDIPRSLREINPHVPDWFDAFVSKLLSKKPDDRIQTASDVSQLLQGALAHVQQPTLVPLPREIRELAAVRLRTKSIWKGLLLGLTSFVVAGAATFLLLSQYGFLEQANISPPPPAIPASPSTNLEWKDALQPEIDSLNQDIQTWEAIDEEQQTFDVRR